MKQWAKKRKRRNECCYLLSLDFGPDLLRLEIETRDKPDDGEAGFAIVATYLLYNSQSFFFTYFQRMNVWLELAYATQPLTIFSSSSLFSIKALNFRHDTQDTLPTATTIFEFNLDIPGYTLANLKRNSSILSLPSSCCNSRLKVLIPLWVHGPMWWSAKTCCCKKKETRA